MGRWRRKEEQRFVKKLSREKSVVSFRNRRSLGGVEHEEEDLGDEVLIRHDELVALVVTRLTGVVGWRRHRSPPSKRGQDEERGE